MQLGRWLCGVTARRGPEHHAHGNDADGIANIDVGFKTTCPTAFGASNVEPGQNRYYVAAGQSYNAAGCR